MIFVGVSKCASECADRPPPLGCLDAGVASWRVVEEKEGYMQGGACVGAGHESGQRRWRAARITCQLLRRGASVHCVRPSLDSRRFIPRVFIMAVIDENYNPCRCECGHVNVPQVSSSGAETCHIICVVQMILIVASMLLYIFVFCLSRCMFVPRRNDSKNQLYFPTDCVFLFNAIDDVYLIC